MLSGVLWMHGREFDGVDFALIAGMVWGRRQEAREAKAKAQHPDEPWHWNPDWRPVTR
jgi:hypothetical protein